MGIHENFLSVVVFFDAIVDPVAQGKSSLKGPGEESGHVCRLLRQKQHETRTHNSLLVIYES